MSKRLSGGALLRLPTLISITVLLTISCLARKDDCVKFQKLIDQTYDFKPSQLTSGQRTAKSKKMDQIWNMVKSDPAKLAPCLKAAVERPNANNFFVFDASNLLFVIEQTRESKERIAKYYGIVDLADVDLKFWMGYIAPLGWEGYDTSAAGENWLKAVNPTYFLAQHGSKKIDKDVGAYIVFGSMEERFATPMLIKISNDRDHPGRAIAVRLLFEMLTDESAKASGELMSNAKTKKDFELITSAIKGIKQIPPREGEPKTARTVYLSALKGLVEGKPAAFFSLTTEIPDGEKDAVAVLTEEDIPLLRKARRFFAALATPHSPDWYQTFTGIIVAIGKKNDAQNVGR